MGTLYVVATPIGNLEDITLRALRVLREVDLIAAEDTRHTGRLLAHYGISTPQTSYHDHNKRLKLEPILEALTQGDVALVCDAGTPGLSDPGYRLVREALARGFPVVPVPGPSALVAALVVSGLPTDAFVFLGFLPRRSGERRRLLAEVADQQRTLVAFEAPHRLLESLADIETVLGDRPIAVARELTKLHEEVWRGTVRQARAHFEAHPPRGEITLVIAGASPEETVWEEETVREALAELLTAGLSPSQAARQIAALSGWPRRRIYRMALERRDGTTNGGNESTNAG